MKLALFMTPGMSLRKWDEAGILLREIKPYTEMAKHFKKIYLITYGKWEEEWETAKKYQKNLPDNIILLCNNSILPDFLYSLLAPLIHWNYFFTFKGIEILKSNQMNGSVTAWIAKKMFGKKPVRRWDINTVTGNRRRPAPGTKLFVRQGYPWLQTLEEKKAPLWKRLIARLTERLAYSVADGIIVTTESDKDRIKQKNKILKEKIHVIPNYIDTDLFKPDPSLRQANRILYVGRLEPEKNLDKLIQAVKGLDGKDLGFELIIIGEGSMRGKLETLAMEEGITNIKFLGLVPNESLPQEYNKATIFVQPSQYEGNPKTLMEAMACGCVVIGSNVRGIKELINHGKTGFLCGAEGYLRGTILATNYLIANQENSANKIRENARALIVENHSLQVVVEKELELYRVKP